MYPTHLSMIDNNNEEKPPSSSSTKSHTHRKQKEHQSRRQNEDALRSHCSSRSPTFRSRPPVKERSKPKFAKCTDRSPNCQCTRSPSPTLNVSRGRPCTRQHTTRSSSSISIERRISHNAYTRQIKII